MVFWALKQIDFVTYIVAISYRLYGKWKSKYTELLQPCSIWGWNWNWDCFSSLSLSLLLYLSPFVFLYFFCGGRKKCQNFGKNVIYFVSDWVYVKLLSVFFIFAVKERLFSVEIRIPSRDRRITCWGPRHFPGPSSFFSLFSSNDGFSTKKFFKFENSSSSTVKTLPWEREDG